MVSGGWHLAIDPGWTCAGWCLWGDDGYVDSNVIKVGHSSYFRELAYELDALYHEAELETNLKRLVIEKPPKQYTGGSQARALALGEYVGAVYMWALFRELDVGYVEIPDWRAAYGIHGDRVECKAQAVRIAKALIGQVFGDDRAEAVLIARYSHRLTSFEKKRLQAVR